MGSKKNSQQAPVHWPREITKAKLSQVIVLFYSHLFIKQWKKRGNREIWASWDKLGQVGTSLDKFGQGNKKEKLDKRQKE